MLKPVSGVIAAIMLCAGVVGGASVAAVWLSQPKPKPPVAPLPLKHVKVVCSDGRLWGEAYTRVLSPQGHGFVAVVDKLPRIVSVPADCGWAPFEPPSDYKGGESLKVYEVQP